jgi:hypothetical protein
MLSLMNAWYFPVISGRSGNIDVQDIEDGRCR